jgi:hypothetical protein
MNEINSVSEQEEADSYFGLCPTCRKTDGYLNVGRSHWFFCKEHEKKWWAGANLFSGWREETEDEQRREYEAVGLGRFEEVVPYHRPQTAAEAEEVRRIEAIPYSTDDELPF